VKIKELGFEVFYCDEPFGTAVDPETLTKKQLVEAIHNYDRDVVREPDGSFNMCDATNKIEYDIVEYDPEDKGRVAFSEPPDRRQIVVGPSFGITE
jgi:hypothetical protein